MKRTIGIVILVVGVALAAFGFYQQSQDNKIIDIGKLEVTQDATNNINIMTIAGIVLTVGGVIVLLTGRKQA